MFKGNFVHNKSYLHYFKIIQKTIKLEHTLSLGWKEDEKMCQFNAQEK